MATAGSGNPETSEQEQAWQKEFVFDRPEVIGMYKRKFKAEVDTADYGDFNRALCDASTTTSVVMESKAFDNDRFYLWCKVNSTAGFLSCYLCTKTGKYKTDTTSRQIFLKLFKRLILRLEIEEELSSDGSTFLSAPSLSVGTIIQRVRDTLFAGPDTCFRLADGEISAHEKLLSRYEHFKAALEGDFAESTLEKAPKQQQPGDMVMETEEIEGLEPMSRGYDSDFDEEGSKRALTRQTPGKMKTVNLPNFSTATFKAFLLYTYTETISFKPLTSAEGIVTLPNEVLKESMPGKAWQCSPKSLYGMADYFDVPMLKELCKKAYLASIEPNTLLHELSHSFARLHKPISDALEDYALKNWTKITASAKFEETIQEVMDYQESRAVLLRILKKTSTL